MNQVTRMKYILLEFLCSPFEGESVCSFLSLASVNVSNILIDKLALQLNEEFQADDSPSSVIYCISLAWFKQWEAFVKAKQRGKCCYVDKISSGKAKIKVKCCFQTCLPLTAIPLDDDICTTL